MNGLLKGIIETDEWFHGGSSRRGKIDDGNVLPPFAFRDPYERVEYGSADLTYISIKWMRSTPSCLGCTNDFCFTGCLKSSHEPDTCRLHY